MTDARPELKEIGSTGLTRFGGRVYEEYLRELSGDRWRRVLREMIDQDPIIGATLFAIEMLIRQVDWSVRPGADDAASVEAATFVQECLHDMAATWPDTLAEILSFLPWGWAYFNVVYKVRQGPQRSADGMPDAVRSSAYTDGRLGWGIWSIRSQDTLDRWEFGDHGIVSGMWQVAPPSYIPTFIPANLALHFRATSRKANPEGRSILRNAYRPYYFKRNIENVEGIGIERDLAGLPIVRIPASVIAANGIEYQAWQNVAINLRRDEQEGLVIPSDCDKTTGKLLYDVELLTTGGDRQIDTDKITQRYSAQIAMTMLADFILLGHEQVGSFALASSKTDLFGVALGAWLDSIAATVNSQAIRPLLHYNGMTPPAPPCLVHSDIESIDLAVLGEYISKLSGAGAPLFPNDDLLAYLLKQAGLPTAKES